MTREEKARRLVAAINKTPAIIDRLFQIAEGTQARVERARSIYARTHWGQKGQGGVRSSTVPDLSSGVVTVLGPLVAVHYLAAKGTTRIDQWEHEFSEPYPVLAFAPEGSRQGLVVVRADSRYTVNERGIVG